MNEFISVFLYMFWLMWLNVAVGWCGSWPDPVCHAVGSDCHQSWETVPGARQSSQAGSRRRWRTVQILFSRRTHRPSARSLPTCLSDLNCSDTWARTQKTQWVLFSRSILKHTPDLFRFFSDSTTNEIFYHAWLSKTCTFRNLQCLFGQP